MLIPPSIPLVIYGVTAGESIGKLFLAVIPSGIIMCLSYCLVSAFVIWKEKMVLVESTTKRTFAEFREVTFEALWALLTPVIILGGIYSGIFTPTESAAAASIYALFVGVFIYRELSLKKFLDAMKKAALSTAACMFIIATATAFCWIMTYLNIPNTISSFILSVTTSRIVFLILMTVFLLFAGMLMDTNILILILTPLLLPAAKNLGIDGIHFGIFMCVNLSVGLISPPFGACLFVSSGITGVPIGKIFKKSVLFILGALATVLLVTFFPVFSVGFVNLFS